MKAGKIVALVIGCVMALVGVALLLGAGGIGWAYSTQRDGDGYFTTKTVRMETVTAVLHSENIDLGSDKRPDAWPFSDGDLATVRIRATAREGQEVFIGIARTSDVENYLTNVAHDEVADVNFGNRDVSYRRREGSVVSPPSPGDQSFWVAKVAGPGRQTLRWDVAGGDWSIVAMNPDARPNVSADIAVGVKVSFLVPLMVGLGIAGLVVLGVATVLIVVATRRREGEVSAPAPVAPALTAARTPVRLNASLDEPSGSWPSRTSSSCSSCGLRSGC
jgi:hypothetical protein